MNAGEIIQRLEANADASSFAGMARVGITPDKAFGVKIPVLRAIAKEAGRDQSLALELWETDTRETRILAGMIGQPGEVTTELMDEWASEFHYWEICDQVIMNLFEKTPFAWSKAVEWSSHENEGIRRAGFVMMARLAVSDKKADDGRFLEFHPLIHEGSTDERNLVKKGVNWALRQIGKRSLLLNEASIETAERISRIDSKSAKWVAMDALRELRSEAVQNRLRKRAGK